MWLNIILIIFSIFVTIYLYFQRKYSYWSNQGVPFVPPTFPYGNFKDVNKTEHMTFRLQRFYTEMKSKGPIIGIYSFNIPNVMLTDLDMIKTVLVKDFNYFTSRGLYYNEKDDVVSAHLFNVDDPLWRKLRIKLTPTFTSGKMKFMFPTIMGVAKEFQKCISREIEKDSIVELKDILARFTTDVIGTCAFGIECNTLVNPNSDFRYYGKAIFEKVRYNATIQLLMSLYPNVARKLHLKRFYHGVSDFFLNIVKSTVKYREENNIQRNDFMNLLMQLKNKGEIDGEDSIKSDNQMNLTIEEIAAQAFVFFAAGFETSSTTMSYCLHELALHTDIQQKTRQEIKDVLKKYNGEITYEAVMEMKYLEQVINETLRKYPPVAFLTRVVVKDYYVPESNIFFEKGMNIYIPAYAIQHDPELYPNPEEFNPDRFSEEEKRKRNPYAFLPFGEGPSNCIGLRFGILQAKIGLITLLLNFKFSVCEKTEKNLKFIQNIFILTSLGGCWLKIEKI